LVADPFRAADAVWPKYVVGGREYRYLLNNGFLLIPEVENEPFVKEAGLIVGIRETRSGGARTITIPEISLYSESGGAVAAKATVSTADANAIVEDPDALFDGRRDTTCVVSAPIWDPFTFSEPVTARIRITAEKPFVKAVIARANSPKCLIAALSADVPGAKLENRDGTWTVTVPAPVTNMELTAESDRYRYEVGEIWSPDKIRDRIQTKPFYIYAPDRCISGLDPKCVDLSGYEKVIAEHPETYLGSDFGEWEGHLLYTLSRMRSDRYRGFTTFCKFPCNREEMVRNFRSMWDLTLSQKGPKMFGMSAQATFQPYACEWGSSLSCVELTSEKRESPYRNTMMFVNGASRQFGVPVYVYTAYYVGDCTCDSREERRNSAGGTRFGTDWGQAPSQGLRQLMMSYYMGSNYESFECMPWGQLKREKDGTVSFTRVGESLRTMWNWQEKPEAKRGEFYAPIVLLLDRKNGHDMMDTRRITEKYGGVGSFIGSYPPFDPDFMIEYAMQAFSPYYGTKPVPDHSTNLRNSRLGDIAVAYLANPLTAEKEPGLEQLAKYPVAFLVDDLAWTESFANTVKTYVANGGTFVLTTGQLGPFADDAAFSGIASTGEKTEADGLVLDRITLSPKARVVEKTSSGEPLAVLNRYGEGHVLVVASPFFKRVKDRDLPPPQMESLLVRMQDELLPMKVEGPCQAIYNVMPDGSWKAVLINNAGVVKKPDEPEEHFLPEFDSDIRLTLPKGATAKELRFNAPLVRAETNGLAVYSFKLPSGAVYVLEVKGLNVNKRSITPRAADPVKPFTTPPYTAILPPHDGYKYDPSKLPPVPPTPPLVGEWRASDGYRDSSGNGHDARMNEQGFGTVNFFADYTAAEGTFEAVVTPAPAADWAKAKQAEGGVMTKGSHNGVSDLFGFGWRKGRWEAYVNAKMPSRRETVVGPEAKAERTHLALVFKHGFLRFYVNGVEAKGENGPMKMAMSEQGRDSFYREFTVLLRTINTVPGFQFLGETEVFRYHGRAFSAAEIAARAAAR